MAGQKKPIIINCDSCGHAFIGASAPPTTVIRIEAPCPACGAEVKIPYGIVTPFSDHLLFLNNSSVEPIVRRDILRKKIGLKEPAETPEAKASIAEIFNAFLIWLEEAEISNGTIEAPGGHVLHFMPLFQESDKIKEILREKLQEILESQNPEKEILAMSKLDPSSGEDNLAKYYLGNLIDGLHEEGFNLAFLISLLMAALL